MRVVVLWIVVAEEALDVEVVAVTVADVVVVVVVVVVVEVVFAAAVVVVVVATPRAITNMHQSRSSPI